MKKILVVAFLLATNQANADIQDSILELIYNQQFAQQETDFINNNMNISDMLGYAYNAWDYTEEFADWLSDNNSELYKEHVMTSGNFPNHPFKGSHYNGGLADTFRHIFWSAQIAQKYGKELAKEYTDLHEFIYKESNSINTVRNKVLLNKSQVSVEYHKWKYYEVTTDNLHSQLKVSIENLTSDVDLYVRKGSKPTLSVSDCSPYKEGKDNEVCNIDLWQSAKYYIGIYGYSSGEFSLKALLLDDQASTDNGIWSNLSPMDYHNNYLGTIIGSNNSNVSTSDLAKKVREFIMGKISYNINLTNSHTQLPQNRPVIYKTFNDISSRELMSFNVEINASVKIASVKIDGFYNTYPTFFGSKVRDNYICYSWFTCQDFNTDKKIAVHNQSGSLYFYDGSGWYKYSN